MKTETQCKIWLAAGFLVNTIALILNVHAKHYFFGATSILGLMWMSYLYGRFKEMCDHPVCLYVQTIFQCYKDGHHE